MAPDVIERVRKAHIQRDPAQAARNAKNYAILKRSVAKLGAAGAHVILGSDTGLEDHFFGYAEQKELELMVQAGMTPSQVIVAATSRPAEYLGLADRGLLREGYRADVTVFDPSAIADRATYDAPHQYAAGVSTVIVNGTVVIDGGDHTGALPGQVLRRPPAA